MSLELCYLSLPDWGFVTAWLLLRNTTGLEHPHGYSNELFQDIQKVKDLAVGESWSPRAKEFERRHLASGRDVWILTSCFPRLERMILIDTEHAPDSTAKLAFKDETTDPHYLLHEEEIYGPGAKKYENCMFDSFFRRKRSIFFDCQIFPRLSTQRSWREFKKARHSGSRLASLKVDARQSRIGKELHPTLIGEHGMLVAQPQAPRLRNRVGSYMTIQVIEECPEAG
jgi:hypothetical protein